MVEALRRIRGVADYQFGKGVGQKLFPNNVKIMLSKRTRRIRYIYLKGERLATMRPTDGLFSLSIAGAKCIAEKEARVECFVTVKNSVSKFIAQGGDVFAIHVIRADEEIRSKDEIIVINEKREILAVGRAILSGEEMLTFKRGVAVRVRHGLVKES